MKRSREATPDLLAALAAGTTFAALGRAVVHPRPTRVDRIAHEVAQSSYHRLVEVAQLPVEIGGLAGVYMPLAALTARWLRRRGRRGGTTIVVAAAAGWVALRMARAAYDRTRPPRPPHRGPKAERSFPSGHTTGVTAFAVAAARVLARERVLSPGAARAIAIGAPLVVGFNRVYVREHWLTDVVGGWLLGGGVGLACTGLADAISVGRRHAPRLRAAPRALARTRGARATRLWTRAPSALS